MGGVQGHLSAEENKIASEQGENCFITTKVSGEKPFKYVVGHGNQKFSDISR